MINQMQPIHVAHGAGTTYRARGGLYTLTSPAVYSGGAFSLWEGTNPPGTGVPPHIQHREDEAFYVLEGTYTFWTVDGVRELGPGSYLLAPRGVAHGFQNDGSGVARLLILQSPGGIHEGYFAEAWEVVDDPANLPPEPEPDFVLIKAAAERAGIELLPPR
jgi:quercetin dioxygenase-like cupin family protein